MSDVFGPRSLMAQFMMATILRDNESRDRVKAKLVSTGWRDADGLVDGALAVALAGHFATPPKLSDVKKLSRKIVKKFPDPRMKEGEVELVVRSALGESADLSAIPSGRVEGLKMLIFAGMASVRGLSKVEVSQLLIEAERWASERGYRPTLMTESQTDR
ncbi:hypothetical protein [Verrucosispora sp. WMMD573]|uniref:hypothetical protein n=1 Tax=Verrucosispora sp. WMMD573 TaxID=3015149 RepID=UPI00248AEBAB|nr:hypothetical protein [Verrucosispora sp. WMMD573]WBB56968.1 hypothetical protein O7601_13365 [Verrucosispora sp. WMMD573]